MKVQLCLSQAPSHALHSLSPTPSAPDMDAPVSTYREQRVGGSQAAGARSEAVPQTCCQQGTRTHKGVFHVLPVLPLELGYSRMWAHHLSDRLEGQSCSKEW